MRLLYTDEEIAAIKSWVNTSGSGRSIRHMPRELRDALCKRHPWGSVCEKTKEIRAEVGVKAGLRRWSESEKSAVLDYLAAHEPRMILNFENVRNKLCPLLPDRTINAVLAMTKQVSELEIS